MRERERCSKVARFEERKKKINFLKNYSFLE